MPVERRKDRIKIGAQLRFFGDGFQISKKFADQRFWRIPVMDGEFLCEDVTGSVKGIGGGNLLVCGRTQIETLTAVRAAVEEINQLSDVVLPFPSGIVRSGSKVGSKYKPLKASTNDAWCRHFEGKLLPLSKRRNKPFMKSSLMDFPLKPLPRR